jgi:hypothetical protein
VAKNVKNWILFAGHHLDESYRSNIIVPDLRSVLVLLVREQENYKAIFMY